MNTLSKKQAQRCEEAKEKVCRCRCGGALHGASRGDVSLLAYGDPHSLVKICPNCTKGKRAMPIDGQLVYYDCGKCKGTGFLYPKVL